MEEVKDFWSSAKANYSRIKFNHHHLRKQINEQCDELRDDFAKVFLPAFIGIISLMCVFICFVIFLAFPAQQQVG